jgi:lipid II:glycine glycyltransferase (peptidoglycan interpeptide bridge formation enzyme)
MFSKIIGNDVSLDQSYEYEIDTLDSKEWSEVLQKFDDASIYQTTAYTVNHAGGNNSNKFILKKEGKICALAYVRISRLPYIGYGMAYIYWGPLWRLHGECVDKNILIQVLKALYMEYVVNQKLYLRITPNFREGEFKDLESLINSAGFQFRKSAKKYLTILLDLSESLDEIRKKFRGNWRNHLKKAEKNNLSVMAGNNVDMYSIYMNMSREMFARKRFSEMPDLKKFKKIQEDLPDELKMQIFICSLSNTPVAAAVAAAVGDTGYYLFAATSHEGMKSQGSYLIQWNMLKWLKDCGCHWYDLCGINPKKNPGVYHFKSGLGGNEIHYIGQIHAYQNKIIYLIIIMSENIRNFIRWMFLHLKIASNYYTIKIYNIFH